jgi:hypothetical protein
MCGKRFVPVRRTLPALQTEQKVNVVIIVHHSHPVQLVLRRSATDSVPLGGHNHNCWLPVGLSSSFDRISLLKLGGLVARIGEKAGNIGKTLVLFGWLGFWTPGGKFGSAVLVWIGNPDGAELGDMKGTAKGARGGPKNAGGSAWLTVGTGIWDGAALGATDGPAVAGAGGAADGASVGATTETVAFPDGGASGETEGAAGGRSSGFGALSSKEPSCQPATPPPPNSAKDTTAARIIHLRFWAACFSSSSAALARSVSANRSCNSCICSSRKMVEEMCMAWTSATNGIMDGSSATALGGRNEDAASAAGMEWSKPAAPSRFVPSPSLVVAPTAGAAVPAVVSTCSFSKVGSLPVSKSLLLRCFVIVHNNNVCLCKDFPLRSRNQVIKSLCECPKSLSDWNNGGIKTIES